MVVFVYSLLGLWLGFTYWQDTRKIADRRIPIKDSDDFEIRLDNFLIARLKLNLLARCAYIAVLTYGMVPNLNVNDLHLLVIVLLCFIAAIAVEYHTKIRIMFKPDYVTMHQFKVWRDWELGVMFLTGVSAFVIKQYIA